MSVKHTVFIRMCDVTSYTPNQALHLDKVYTASQVLLRNYHLVQRVMQFSLIFVNSATFEGNITTTINSERPGKLRKIGGMLAMPLCKQMLLVKSTSMLIKLRTHTCLMS